VSPTQCPFRPATPLVSPPLRFPFGFPGEGPLCCTTFNANTWASWMQRAPLGAYIHFIQETHLVEAFDRVDSSPHSRAILSASTKKLRLVHTPAIGTHRGNQGGVAFSRLAGAPGHSPPATHPRSLCCCLSPHRLFWNNLHRLILPGHLRPRCQSARSSHSCSCHPGIRQAIHHRGRF
jgi:hypothetical protein